MAYVEHTPEDNAAAPALTVVVVMLEGPDYLARCLEALARQKNAPHFEIIVPCDERLGDAAALRAKYPQAQFARVPGKRTYAELRAIGVRRARGPIVALTEDHCAPEPAWCAEILNAHAAPHAAIGGAVEKGPDAALNWAIYLCDFGRYMQPVREGPAGYLTDCNVSYKRAALASLAEVWAGEFHEPVVHGTLKARGETLWLSPRIVVRQQRSLSWGSALWDRYAFGRLFASTRPEAAAPMGRALYAALAIALPPFIVARVATDVLRKRRHFRELARALPALILVTSAWAWGEFAGYVTGRPVDSLSAKP